MILTQRDQSLFEVLQKYGLMRTRELALKVFPGVALTTVLRRLRVLEESGYVRRIEGLPSKEIAWLMTAKSAARIDGSAVKLHAPRHTLDHDAMLTALRLHLERIGIAESWIAEHEVRSSIARSLGLKEAKRRVVPDGIMGAEIGGRKESVAIELELSFKNSNRYRQIFSDYADKRNLHLVWYIVGDKSIGNHLMKCRRQGYYRTPPFVGWSVLEEVMHDPSAAVIRFKDGETSLGSAFKRAEAGRSQALEPAHTPALPVSGPAPLIENTVVGVTLQDDSATLPEAI